MEKAFLRQVAALFKDDNLDDYTFVFPNRRSSLFFLKHLGELKKQPLFAPKVFTIDNLFNYLSDLEVVDDLALIFRLWKSYRDLQGEKAEGIDEFISWGSIILSDFNDVDQYMVDARQLFMNLKDIKDLESGTDILEKSQIDALKKIADLKTELKDKDETQRKFLTIWEMLLPLYNSFRESLKKDKLAYSGMLYRSVIEGIMKAEASDPLISKLGKLGKVVFIGFSAPSECEKRLMEYFKNHGGLLGLLFIHDQQEA